MSELNEGGSFAAASSGKSPAEIAFELVSKLKGQGVWGERNMADILDMYAECLDAANGLRTYTGQNRVDLPVKSPGGAVAQAARAATPASAPAAPPTANRAPVTAQPAHAQPQHAPQAAPHPVQAAPQQPVQAQQQVLQQAFRQG